MRENIVQRVVIIFLLALTILSLVAYVAVDNVRRAAETGLWVNNTHAIIMETDGILSSLHKGDAALRGYLITGDSRDQSAYRAAYSDMLGHLTVAKALTKNEPGQSQRIALLEPLIARRINYTRSLVKTRQESGLDAARKKLLDDSGGESLLEIQKAVERIEQKEKSLIRDRDKQTYLEARTTRWTVLTGIATNFILLGFTAFSVRDDIRARRRLAELLEQTNSQLETKVAERTAELATANEILRSENLERQWSNKALEHQLRYSNLIINSINDLVFVLTKSLTITRINPAVTKQIGLEPKDLITAPLFQFLHDVSGNGGVQQQLTQALRDGRELHGLPIKLRSSGSRVTAYRLNLFPLRDRDKVVGGVVTLRLERDNDTPNINPSPV